MAEDKRPKAEYGPNRQKNYKDNPGCNEMFVLEDGPEWVIVLEPLYRTEDQRIVHENHLDGRWLAYPKGARIKREEAIRMGFFKEKEDKNRKPGGKK